MVELRAYTSAMPLDEGMVQVRILPEVPYNMPLVLTAARRSPKPLVGVRIPQGMPFMEAWMSGLNQQS